MDLLNLINHSPAIDIICLYAKDSNKSKYQFLIEKHEEVDLKHFENSESTIEYSNDIKDVYSSIKKYNLRKERKVLIVFHDMMTCPIIKILTQLLSYFL